MDLSYLIPLIPFAIMASASLAIALGASALFDFHKNRRRAKHDREEMALYIEQQKQLNPIVIDWRPTGRINMICADPAIMLNEERHVEEADFILLIEEKRLVADISGAPTLQTQWRKASRRDARNTVKLYNERAIVAGPGEQLEQHVIAGPYVPSPQTVEAMQECQRGTGAS
jgi:hypothetical protein